MKLEERDARARRPKVREMGDARGDGVPRETKTSLFCHFKLAIRVVDVGDARRPSLIAVQRADERRADRRGDDVVRTSDLATVLDSGTAGRVSEFR